MVLKCCKKLYKMTEDHSIWNLVHHGMHSLVPTFSTMLPIGELSSSKLKEEVITACHLDQCWRHPKQTPTKLETILWHSLTVNVKLQLARGRWVLSLCTNNYIFRGW